MILAHAGGWDEFLYFVVPIVIALGAIRWANRRARANAADDAVPRTGSWLSSHAPGDANGEPPDAGDR